MKVKFLLIVFLIGFSCVAQNLQKADSLKKSLVTAVEDSNKVKTLYTLAQQYVEISPDSSIYYSKLALDLSEKIQWNKGIEMSSHNLGYAYYLKSDFSHTIEYWQKCADISKANTPENYAIYIGNIGAVYWNLGNYPKSLESHFEALKMNEKLNSKKDILLNYNNIGVVYTNLSEHQNALDYYNKALKIAKETNDVEGEALTLGNIGNVYNDKKEYNTALEYYFKALDINTELDEKYSITSNLSNIGSAYTELLKSSTEDSEIEEYKNKALEYSFRSLKMDEEMGNREGYARNSANIGIIYTYTKRFNGAEKFLRSGEALADSLGSLDLQKELLSYLSDLYAAKGNNLLALEYYKKYIAVRDSIYNEENTKKNIRQQMTYDFDKKESELKAQQEKKDALASAESRKQKIIIWFVISGLIVVIVFSVFLLRLFIQKKKANAILAQQKLEIEEKNEELNQQNEEIAAQRDEIEAQRDTVVKQKEHIEEIHLEVSQSIDYATRLQTSILPDTEILKNEISDYFVFFRPKDKVSGDFYWWAKVEDTLVIAAADCTGHGVPGAFMSMLGVSLLREIVTREYITNPAVILRKLRKEVIKSLKQSGESGTHKDGMDISLLAINNSEKVYEWAGANNPLWIVKKDDNNEYEEIADKVVEIKADKMPIAIYEKMDKFTSHKIDIKKGDRLYMFSDGLPDQFGGDKGKKFKYKTFRRLIAETSDLTMKDQYNELEKALDNWMHPAEIGKAYEQVDDICIIGLML